MPIGIFLNTAWRNIVRHKLFSIINIIGLAIGLASSILIALFIRDEVSYDDFWQDANQIYRVHMEFKLPAMDEIDMVWSPGPLGPALKREIPQIEYVARINRQNPTITENENVTIEEINLVDPDIIKIFNFSVLAGDLIASLDDSNSIALNQSRAKARFGREDPIDKILTIDFGNVKKDYKVAAIFEDIPLNSQIELTSMVAINEVEWAESGLLLGWYYTTVETFYKLKNGANNDQVVNQLIDFVDRIFPFFGNTSPDAKSSEVTTIRPVSISDLHLKTTGYGDQRPLGDQTIVVTFSAVAILIVIIASINFMNLSTARASQRAKEIALRKVMGASRTNLIRQFLGESVFITMLAHVIALVFVECSLPTYNQILSKNLFIDYASTDFLLITLLALLAGLLGGIYPAFILSSFRPGQVLRTNKSSNSNASMRLRSILVIFQFSVSIALFVATAVVFGQVTYAKNKDLGYIKENLLIINGLARPALKDSLEFLEKEIKQFPEVTSIAMSEFEPARTGESVGSLRLESGQDLVINAAYVGYNFFKTYEIPLLAGREFDKNRNDNIPIGKEISSGVNTRGVILLNQSALNSFGIGDPEEAIGKVLYQDVQNGDSTHLAEFEIIGVIPDVYFYNLKRVIAPTAFYLETEIQDIFSLRYTGNPNTILKKVETLWQLKEPNIPFDYDYITDMVAAQYTSEDSQMVMFAAFAGLAVLIACLGLFGLASFTAEQRSKEIGVRKVLGATTSDVVKLLIWQFSKPVLIANIIAWPAAYLAMSWWLESFIYRIDDIVIIALCLIAGLTALLIAWATVAGNSYAVARQNPIKALRYE